MTFDLCQCTLTNMTTIDNLLFEILQEPDDYAKGLLPRRDYDTLISLSTAITRPFYITKNQGRLLIKILQENSKKLEKFSEKISMSITTPIWSKEFRYVEEVKNLKIQNNSEAEPELVIEFTFSGQIRKVLSTLSKTVENLIQTANTKIWTAELNEKNIVALVDALLPLGFKIDEIVKNHYETIKSWSEQEIRDQFLITNFENKNFQHYITEDLGIETSIDQNIINDRSMRYQYFVENPKNPGENLTEYMANRSKTKLWVDKKLHDLDAVIKSIIELKRLPMLVVFENTTEEKILKNLEILSNFLEKNEVDKSVGIYFRLPNSEIGKEFNQLIKNKSYNNALDKDTQIAVVQSGKIPKFFLKNAWRPMSVLALDTKMGLRHGKTSVYSNCCDLIIEWADEPVMMDIRTILR